MCRLLLLVLSPLSSITTYMFKLILSVHSLYSYMAAYDVRLFSLCTNYSFMWRRTLSRLLLLVHSALSSVVLHCLDFLLVHSALSSVILHCLDFLLVHSALSSVVLHCLDFLLVHSALSSVILHCLDFLLVHSSLSSVVLHCLGCFSLFIPHSPLLSSIV